MGAASVIRDRIVELRRVRASELVPNPDNWRTHPRKQQEAMRGVLHEIGYAGALLARQLEDGRLMLIDGHLRAEVTPNEKVPVIVLDVDEAEADKLLALFDPISAMAGKNNEALVALLSRVKSEDAGVQELLTKLGQSTAMLDDVAVAPVENPDCKPGDIFELGSHRLLCGDSTKPSDLSKLFGGSKANLLATDPPYGIAYDNAARVNPGSHKGTEGKSSIENDDLQARPELQEFLERAIRAALPHLVEECAFYLWHPMLTQGTFFAAAAAAAADILIHRQIIWVKPGLLIGRGDYHWRHELCFYGWRRGHRPPFYGPRNQDTVWEVGYDADRNDTEHATPKPVAIWKRPIENHTKRGDVIFEPFSGSGSQIIAAEQAQRRCFAIEIDPRFVMAAVRRWEIFTGKKAKKS